MLCDKLDLYFFKIGLPDPVAMIKWSSDFLINSVSEESSFKNFLSVFTVKERNVYLFIFLPPKAKYKGTIKADLSNSLYKQMPATIDSVFAREVTQLQSEVWFS